MLGTVAAVAFPRRWYTSSWVDPNGARVIELDCECKCTNLILFSYLDYVYNTVRVYLFKKHLLNIEPIDRSPA